MILLIDNYDSFTYNLAHLIGAVDPKVEVRRNDEISAEEAIAFGADAIVLSPGPCTPNEAGICLRVVELAGETNTPLFGVCLGHQSIGQTYGGKVERAAKLMHGKTSTVHHNGDNIFKDLPEHFEATRYHSLVVNGIEDAPQISAIAHAMDDREVMAIRIEDKPIYGVQFHPESIASEHGEAIIRNFLNEVQ
jgi:anthranilate synthase component 2